MQVISGNETTKKTGRNRKALRVGKLNFYKMKKILFTTVLFATHFLLQAQAPAIEWAKCYGGNGGDYGNTIQQTPDGGYIIAGTIGNTFSDFSSGGDIIPHDTVDCEWIVKIDEAGAIQWQKFGAQKIGQTFDGGYIGISKLKGLTKMDQVGNTIWQYATTISGELSVKQTSDSGFIMNNALSGASYDFRITKIDANGNFLWHSDTVGGTGDDIPSTVITVKNGGFLQVGSSKSVNGDVTDHHGDHTTLDCWVVRYDSLGHVIWTKSYGGTGVEMAQDVVQTADGNYVIIAKMNSAADGDISEHFGGEDIWLIKIDDSGTILWKKTFGSILNESPNRIKQTSDGGFIITGGGPAGSNHGASADMYVLKIDENGVKQWDKSLGSIDNESGDDIIQTTDGGYVVIGMTQQHNGDNGDVVGNHGKQDFWVVKLGEGTNGLSDLKNETTLAVYPNPANDFITIGNLSIGSTITITDITGKTIYKLVSDVENPTINTSSFINGVYIIDIQDKSERLTLRFIKQ